MTDSKPTPNGCPDRRGNAPTTAGGQLMNYQNPMLPTQKQLDHWKLEYLDDAIGFNDAMVQSFQLGADWQLEQVIEWLKETKCNQYLYLWEHGAEMEKDELIADLKKAMRPQEDK